MSERESFLEAAVDCALAQHDTCSEQRARYRFALEAIAFGRVHDPMGHAWVVLGRPSTPLACAPTPTVPPPSAPIGTAAAQSAQTPADAGVRG
ncbi:MAG TPA: hypothetical protein VK626_01660 [Nitrospiraceae bacterium]|nr:hypothetical protein [Nitrospiraceae bacterium]